MLSPSNPLQVTRRRRAGGLLLDHPRHAWVHTTGSTMDGQSAYDILGIDSSVSLDEIKSTYRSLAKKYHPDKNSSNGSTALFQWLNQAYQTQLKCHISAGHDGDSLHAGPVCVDSISDITLHTKENTFFVTIDITDIMFLVILSECESHHDVIPIDRGIDGQQLRFPWGIWALRFHLPHLLPNHAPFVGAGLVIPFVGWRALTHNMQTSRTEVHATCQYMDCFGKTPTHRAQAWGAPHTTLTLHEVISLGRYL